MKLEQLFEEVLKESSYSNLKEGRKIRRIQCDDCGEYFDPEEDMDCIVHDDEYGTLCGQCYEVAYYRNTGEELW